MSSNDHWLEIGEDIYTPEDVQAVYKKIKEIRDDVLEKYRLVDAVALTHAVRMLMQLEGMLYRQQETQGLREMLEEPQTLMPVVSQEEYDAHLARGDDLASHETMDVSATTVLAAAFDGPFDPTKVIPTTTVDNGATMVDGVVVGNMFETVPDAMRYKYPLRPIRDNPQA